MWTEEHKAAVDVFLKDPTKQLLVVYVDEFAGLKMEHAIPYQVCLLLGGHKGTCEVKGSLWLSAIRGLTITPPAGGLHPSAADPRALCTLL